MRMIGPFEIGEPLARGGHAVVHLATRTDAPHLDLVAKVSRPGDEYALHRENLALRATRHISLIAPVAFVDDGTHAVLVLPRAACSLGALEGHLDEHEVVHIVVAIASALDALHRDGVAHGDVSPANVLLLDGTTPVLADLGCAHAATAGAIDADVIALARIGLAALAPDERGPVHAALTSVVQGTTQLDDAAGFLELLRVTGVAARPTDARAITPVTTEPPTLATSSSFW